MYNLVKEFVKFGISSEIFTDTLNSLIENESVIVNTFRNENGELINGKSKQLRYWTNFLELKIPGYENLKGTLMQIWKSPYMIVFISKQYPESFAFLILRILELFTRKACKFLKK